MPFYNYNPSSQLFVGPARKRNNPVTVATSSRPEESSRKWKWKKYACTYRERKREREREREIKGLVVLAEPSERASEDERRASSSRTNYLNSQLSAPSRRWRKDSRERDSHLPPFFCASLLSLSRPFSFSFSFSFSCLHLALSFSSFLRTPPAIRLYTSAHTCTGASAARDFPSPFSLRLSFARSSLSLSLSFSLCSVLLLKHLRRTGVRVSFFRKLLPGSWNQGGILWWISCRSPPFFADLLRSGI